MITIDTELIEKKRDKRDRRITPRSEREALARAYEQSGLPQKAFAQREGIKFPTFVSWLQDDADVSVGPTDLPGSRAS